MPLPLDISRLPRDIQYPFDQISKEFPLGGQHLQDGIVTPAKTSFITSGTWVPTWTGSVSNPAIGNGLLAGTYFKIGTLVKIDIRVEPGSTTTFGSGGYNLTLPFNAKTGRQVIPADLLDTGTQHYVGLALIDSSGGVTAFNEILVGSNAVGPGNWQHNSPFTFGNGDRFLISGVYEAAS